MRTKRMMAGKDWEFDGSTITVRIPMTWKRHGGRKVIIAPDGSDAWAPAKLRPDETLIRAVARAHRWKRLLEEGKYRSAAEIADAEGVTRSFVNRLLRLTLLAPRYRRGNPRRTAAKGAAAGRADARNASRLGPTEMLLVSPLAERRRQGMLLVLISEWALQESRPRDCR
jgi:hypothetical protein